MENVDRVSGGDQIATADFYKATAPIPYKVFTYEDGEVIVTLRVDEIQGVSYAQTDHHKERTVVVQFTEGFAKISGFDSKAAVSRFNTALANAIDAEEARRVHNAALKRNG